MSNKYLTIGSLVTKLRDKNVVFIGLGNKLRCDDAVGCYIVEQLKERISLKNFIFFNVETNIENYINQIVNKQPDVIIFIDATKNIPISGSENNDYILLTKDQLQNFTFSTHNISLSTIIEFILDQSKLNYNKSPLVYVMAVKIFSLELAAEMTLQSKHIADKIINDILCNTM
ncbi:MAG: hydrogenase maturation protease [Endomicrobia bacterium]|nr:hydrogenase maturation protease [Endomicrobiia bacterium]